jgi:hypothetical protein
LRTTRPKNNAEQINGWLNGRKDRINLKINTEKTDIDGQGPTARYTDTNCAVNPY